VWPQSHSHHQCGGQSTGDCGHRARQAGCSRAQRRKGLNSVVNSAGVRSAGAGKDDAGTVLPASPPIPAVSASGNPGMMPRPASRLGQRLSRGACGPSWSHKSSRWIISSQRPRRRRQAMRLGGVGRQFRQRGRRGSASRSLQRAALIARVCIRTRAVQEFADAFGAAG
jgi:hypothetical protein